MLYVLLSVALQATLPAEPPAAANLLTRFADDFCVPAADRSTRVRVWNIPGWKATRAEVRTGITYSVDAPTPKHDRHEFNYEGDVKGGRADLSFYAFDFMDPSRPDYSRASLTIRPESLISKEAVERTLAVKLVPNGKVIERPGVITISGGGEPTVTTSPYSEWMQHYQASSTFGDTVTITARRKWGSIGDQQSWYIACGSYTPPINL